MFAVVWPFLAGLGMGGLVAWIVSGLIVTANPVHGPTKRREAWTVSNIAARIERERFEVEQLAASRHQVC